MSNTEHSTTDTKRFTAGSSGMWFFIIIAGLFIAAVNFVNVMSHDDSAPHGAAATHESSAVQPENAHEGHHETAKPEETNTESAQH